MIAMTTSNSMSVKAERKLLLVLIAALANESRKFERQEIWTEI